LKYYNQYAHFYCNHKINDASMSKITTKFKQNCVQLMGLIEKFAKKYIKCVENVLFF